MKKIAILGSTGSIGTQSLDVIRNTPNIKVVALTTNTQIELLEQQINEFKPDIVAVMNKQKAKLLEQKLRGSTTKVYGGMDGIIYAAANTGADMVITAVVGTVGLLPTIEAINNKIDIALANKETLVTAGEIVIELANKNNVQIIPVDSEHSAIFQCLKAGKKNEVSKLILTASGGPFRDLDKTALEKVTVKDALKHPNWNMGAKISIDSSTLMNKGLEVIEAKYLFDTNNIDVVIHKESIVHSMVEFNDTSVIAQLGMPDMRAAISYALNYPMRPKNEFIPKIDWTKKLNLTFDKPNTELFPCLNLAYYAMQQAGTMPTVLNAANEVAVDLFMKNKIKFMDIGHIIHNVLDRHICIFKPSLEEILETDMWARKCCEEEVML